MPLKTPYYNLEAFLWGEVYSSAADKRRFTAIDSQMGFLSDMIGEGRISGWEVSVKNLNTRTLSISTGVGIIGRKVLISFGSFEFSLLNNVTEYVYMREILNQIGGFSNFSNMASIFVSDNIAPASPLNLISVLSLITYNQISFQWDANTEADFSHYIIKRSADEVYGGFEEIAQTKDISYIDLNLPQDTEFTYQVIAVDLSGNESDPTEIVISTLPDLRVPTPPLFFQLFPSNSNIQAIWDNSPFENVDRYRLLVEELDTSNNVVLSYSVSVLEQDLDSTSFSIDALKNNINYRITVFSVNINGVESDGLLRYAVPIFSPGAGEVENISITFNQSEFEEVGIEADLSWDFVNADDPYEGQPDLFRIIFIENGRRQSEPIDILATNRVEYNTIIRFLPFLNDDGEQVFESFKEYTPYILIIQTVDVEENISTGVIKRINRTPTFDTLQAVSGVRIVRNIDNTVTASWINPSSQFLDYISLTIRVLDLGTNIQETVIEDSNISQATTYTVLSSFFGENKRYNFIFTPVDIFVRNGLSSTNAVQFLDEDLEENPEAPQNISILSADGSIQLKWSINFGEESNIEFFKIYRAVNQVFIPPEDFTLLATITASNDSFIDFTAVKDITYTYFVTSIDVFGNESLNPVSNGFIFGALPLAVIRDSVITEEPTGLSVTKINTFDALVSWDAEVSNFDGYEIYRSKENNYSFVLVGSVFATESSFLDEDALLKGETIYYYLVRKFRNEVQPIVTSSLVPPSNSIILASIVTFKEGNNQKIVVDNTLARELENFEEPIREKTIEKLSVHAHIIEDGLDKRIEIRSNSIVTDWFTFDFKAYTTESDITGASSFIVRISGAVNEEFFTNINGVKDVVAIRQVQAGISPILFEVDDEKGKITFRDPIFTTCSEPGPDPLNPDAPPICPVVPYLTEPVITLELVELSEVDNLLPSEKIESISATQVISGEVSRKQLPVIKHEGRINENLLPLQLPMTTIDNYVYEIANVFEDSDRNKIGDAVTFYDIVQVGGGDDLVAATSNGIWFSDDFGNNWNHRISFSEPVKRVFRSSEDVYYSITNYDVFKNTSANFANWKQMGGLEFVKVIRDIDEDSSGNIYISTDLGVFRLNKDKPFIGDTWEQLEIFGPTSTDAFGILFNTSDDRILVGNELGLVQSLDEGRSWFYDANLPANTKIERFLKVDNTVFALTNDSIFRKEDSETIFTKIADLGTSVARNIVMINDTLYVATDIGPRFSASANIYDDIDIDFVPALSLINIKGRPVVVTSINRIDNNLFIGTDRRLFLLDNNDNFWLQYEQLGTVVPTVFINGVERELGVFYNNGGDKQNIVFDERLSTEDIITLSNKYDIYVSEFNGWIEQKFDAKVKIRANNIPWGETTENIIVDKAQFTAFVFPVYNDENAHKEGADTYKTAIETNIQSISDSDSLSSDDLRNLITITFRNLEKFLSQLYVSAKIDVQLPNIIIKLVEKTQVIDSFGNLVNSETNLNATVNSTTGAVVFNSPFDKFDELKIDIFGVTVKNEGELSHREVEDILELANSGFPSSLSQVQQVNLVKLGIFNERQWPGRQTALMSPPFQSEYIIPRGDSWFDTLNSTINYSEDITQDGVNLRLNYVTSALFLEERNLVLAGGKGGVLSIDVSTLDISEVNISSNISAEFVKSIKRNNDSLYIVTNKNIYLSEDLGFVWSIFDRTGLSNNLNSIGFVLNNIIIGTEDGIYYKGSKSIEWQKSIDSTSPVEIIINPDLLFAVIDNAVYLSGDGFTFFKLETKHTFNINDIEKFGASMYIGTDEGLYTDISSFYGTNPRMLLIDVEGVPEDTPVNSMSANTSFMGVGLGINKYYLQQGEEFQVFNSNAISAAQNVLAVNDDLWIFSYDSFVISSLDSSVILSSGVPV
jgi:hypothetical protein